MKYLQLKTTIALSVALGIGCSATFANQIELVAGSGYSGGTGGSYNPYQNGVGGEFTVLNVNVTNGAAASYTPAGYSSNALYTFPSGGLVGLTGFETFCVQGGSNDVTFTPGQHYNVTTSQTILGGPHDPTLLTKGVALLYSEFATGNLSLYHYTGSSRYTDAGLLQNAIWMLENEIAPDINNSFYSYAFNTLGGGHVGDAASFSDYGVSVLNLTDANGKAAQNQLIYSPVPDGGWTAALLGIALLGLAALRRRIAA